MSASKRVAGDIAHGLEYIDRAVGELLPGHDFYLTRERSPGNRFNKKPRDSGDRDLVVILLTGGQGNAKPKHDGDVQAERCLAE